MLTASAAAGAPSVVVETGEAPSGSSTLVSEGADTVNIPQDDVDVATSSPEVDAEPAPIEPANDNPALSELPATATQ
jgi:hypothetical protein